MFLSVELFRFYYRQNVEAGFFVFLVINQSVLWFLISVQQVYIYIYILYYYIIIYYILIFNIGQF